MSLWVKDIDWSTWVPDQEATLLFVIQEGRILLIRKKRGFGQGKINGPGGKMEPGETPRQCAIRETQEELCITPSGVEEAGLLYFEFADGFKIHGHVYTATGFAGVPTETEEAIPLWFALDEMPYEEMWEDDEYWVPNMLRGERFVGTFTFEGDRMLDGVVEVNGHKKSIAPNERCS